MHSNESFKDYGGGTFTECGRDQEAPTTAVPSTYNIRQFELLSVTINDETFLEIVRDTSSESRKDLLGRSKLDQIKVFNGEGDLINIFDLQHSYFGDEERDPENKLRL